MLIPRRICGVKVTLVIRDKSGEVDSKGRVWKVVSSLVGVSLGLVEGYRLAYKPEMEELEKSVMLIRMLELSGTWRPVRVR